MAEKNTDNKKESKSSDHFRKTHPDWSMLNPKEIESRVIELAKEGKSTSEIGTILRDQYAVPDVKTATGKKIGGILKDNDLATEVPEDLKNVITRAVKIREHLEEHNKDLKNKRNLQLAESKIRRLVAYYKENNRLPQDWRYSPKQAKLMVE